MKASQILKSYRAGERAPVQGPFTYIEALGLVAINEKLLTALKDLDAVPFGSGAATLRIRTRAHYNAVALIAEMESA